ncbi:MAG: RNA polymerase sigma factor [Acidimicrobiales bacterium]
MAGADDSFDRFFADNYTGICRALWLAAGSSCDPEDAAQEAFARALRKWRIVGRLDRPATWVFVVAMRELRRQHGRRAGPTGPVSRDESDGDPTAEVARRVTVLSALETLAPRQRLAVVLRYHADLSVAEIARAMQCREGTVKATLHHALGRLRLVLLDERPTTEVPDA